MALCQSWMGLGISWTRFSCLVVHFLSLNGTLRGESFHPSSSTMHPLFSFMYRLPTSTLAKWCSKEFAWRVALNGCFLDSKLSWQDHILFCWRSRRCLRLLQACISWGSHWKMHYLHITLILSTFNYGSYSASASLLTPWYNPYCCLLCISRCLLILQLRSSIVNRLPSHFWHRALFLKILCSFSPIFSLNPFFIPLFTYPFPAHRDTT